MSSQERIAASRAAGTFETDHALLEAIAANNYARGASDMAGRAVSDVEALFALIADEQERVEDRHDQYLLRISFVKDDLLSLKRRMDRIESSREFESGRIASIYDRVDVLLVGVVMSLVGGVAGVLALVGSAAGWW